MAHQLRRLGFDDVRILKGGLAAWVEAGLPLEANPSPAAGSASAR